MGALCLIRFKTPVRTVGVIRVHRTVPGVVALDCTRQLLLCASHLSEFLNKLAKIVHDSDIRECVTVLYWPL